MAITIIFAVAGITLALLLLAKIWEDEGHRSFFLLRVISKGDYQVRELSHNAVEKYSDLKYKADFFVKRQFPLHTKNFLNKTNSYLHEQIEEHIGNIRNSRLLKKSDGLSEYFKNMSKVEKGNGEINDPYDTFQNEEK